MTESEWQASSDPAQMLHFVSGLESRSGRKLRLYGSAYYRRVWHLLHDARWRRAIEVQEASADGETLDVRGASPEEMHSLREAIIASRPAPQIQNEQTADAALLRDIFG